MGNLAWLVTGGVVMSGVELITTEFEIVLIASWVGTSLLWSQNVKSMLVDSWSSV